MSCANGVIFYFIMSINIEDNIYSTAEDCDPCKNNILTPNEVECASFSTGWQHYEFGCS